MTTRLIITKDNTDIVGIHRHQFLLERKKERKQSLALSKQGTVETYSGFTKVDTKGMS
jgi:hypothetical protein